VGQERVGKRKKHLDTGEGKSTREITGSDVTDSQLPLTARGGGMGVMKLCKAKRTSPPLAEGNFSSLAK